MSLFKKSNKKDKRMRSSLQIQEEQKYVLDDHSDFFLREAYKTLRTNVTFSLTEEGDCKVITVTSALQSEGKSITAMNLAISFGQMGRKVLIIDCDMRKPKVYRLLGISSKVGLSNVLMKSELLDEAIQKVRERKIDVLLAGDIPPNPSELLSSSRMKRLLEKLKERYDYVILDTPPVDMVTDAVVLAPQTDGVLFVVRARHTDRNAVAHAVEQLEYARIKILGFVFNGAAMEETNYGYGKYHYSRYHRYSRYGYRRYGYNRYGYGGYGYGGYGYGYGYGYNEMPQHSQPDQQESK